MDVIDKIKQIESVLDKYYGLIECATKLGEKNLINESLTVYISNCIMDKIKTEISEII